MSPTPEELLRKLLQVEKHDVDSPQYVSIDRLAGTTYLTLDTVVQLTDEEAEVLRPYLYGMGGS